MKKKIIAAALFAITLVSFPSLAQQPEQTAAKCTEQTCTQSEKCTPQKCNPFEGLNLTEQQQASIKELQKQRADQAKNEKEKARKDKAQRDSSARENRRQSRLAYLQQLKGILTPEQYVSFLENSYAGNSNRDKARKDRKVSREKQGDKRPYCKFPQKDKR